MEVRDFALLTDPSSVAVVGASEATGSYGWRVLRNLTEYGTPRRVYAVNPRRAGGTVLGLPAHASLRDLPEAPDCTLVIVPPAAVPGALADMGALGSRVGVVLTAAHGAGDAQARAFDAMVAQHARRHDLHLVGPNSMGLVSGSSRFAGTFGSGMLTSPGESDPAPPGTVAMLSQSGAAISYLLEHFRGHHVGYSHLISTGNEAVLPFTDLLDNLVGDDATRSIVLFIESVADGRGLYDAVARARAAGKAVVIMKIGNSDAGRAAAQSHSGRLAGDATPYEAMAAELGVIAVRGYQQLFDAVAMLNAFPPGLDRHQWRDGKRAAIVTTSGGAAVVAIDDLRARGWTVPPLSASTRAALARELDEPDDVDNPLDLLDLWRDERRLAATLRILDASGDVDQVVAVLGGGGPRAAEVCRRSGTLAAEELTIPVVFAGVGLRPDAQAALEASGAAFLPDISRAVAAMRDRLASEAPTVATARADDPPVADPVDARAATTAIPSGELLRQLDAAGIACAPFALMDMSDEAGQVLSAARRVGYPVAIKIEHAELLHKSDVKAVLLDVRDDAELVAAHARLNALSGQLGLSGAQLLVQRMVTGVEVLVGARLDAQFGHVLVVGLGGTLTELLHDVRPALLPTTREHLARLVAGHERLSRLLAGYRTAERPDTAALVDQLDAIAGWISRQGPRLREADINPLVVTPGGAYVVDGRAVISGPLSTPVPAGVAEGAT